MSRPHTNSVIFREAGRTRARWSSTEIAGAGIDVPYALVEATRPQRRRGGYRARDARS